VLGESFNNHHIVCGLLFPKMCQKKMEWGGFYDLPCGYPTLGLVRFEENVNNKPYEG
jgi:hypothetical protein